MSTNRPEHDASDTIIAIPRTPGLQPLAQSPDELDDVHDVEETRFKIRLANTEGRRSNASYLIERRYAWRGYHVAPATADSVNVITFAVFDHDRPIATLAVGTDSPEGLVVEKLYSSEVRDLRAKGGVLCEFTRLAVDNEVKSRSVLAGLFHIAYIHVRELRRASDLLIEVNPRHVKFYCSMLGFEVIGGERMDPRVKAPAVLLRLDLAYAEAEIARWGGHRERAGETRLLYPLFFSPSEAKGIEGRLRNLE